MTYIKSLNINILLVYVVNIINKCSGIALVIEIEDESIISKVTDGGLNRSLIERNSISSKFKNAINVIVTYIHKYWIDDGKPDTLKKAGKA